MGVLPFTRAILFFQKATDVPSSFPESLSPPSLRGLGALGGPCGAAGADAGSGRKLGLRQGARGFGALAANGTRRNPEDQAEINGTCLPPFVPRIVLSKLRRCVAQNETSGGANRQVLVPMFPLTRFPFWNSVFLSHRNVWENSCLKRRMPEKNGGITPYKQTDKGSEPQTEHRDVDPPMLGSLRVPLLGVPR